MLEPLIAEYSNQAQPKRRQRLLVVLWVLAGSAIVASGWLQQPPFKQVKAISEMGYAAPTPLALPAGLTANQRLLLGDPRLSPLEQKQQLLASDPDNPAYFAEYIAAYVTDWDALPEDWEAQAKRIDPDNALYCYRAATHGLKEVLEKETTPLPPGPRRELANGKLAQELRSNRYTILDRAAYDAAIAQLVKGTEMSRVDDYTMDLAKERVALIPITSYASFLHALTYAFNSNSSLISLVKTADLINARAGELAAQGDAAGLREWCVVRERLINQLLHTPEDALVNELVYAAVATNTAIHLHQAAAKLGLEDLAATYGRQQAAFQEWKDLKRSGRYGREETQIMHHGSLMSSLMLPVVTNQVANPPALSDDDLKPMRLAEHDLFGQFAIGLSSHLLILLAAIYWLARRCLPAAARKPATTLASLLTRNDWVIIASCGIILPILLQLLILRHTPLGARDYGIRHLLFLMPFIPYGCLLISLLLLPSWLIHRRLRQHAPQLLAQSRMEWLRPLQIALLLVSLLIAMPILVYTPSNLSLYLLIGLPSLVLLSQWIHNGWRALRHGPLARLQLATTASAMQVVFPLAIIALCATLPTPIASESHWIQQDRIHLPTSPQAYERQIAVQARKELRQRLGMEE